jgi:hypothetical protein
LTTPLSGEVIGFRHAIYLRWTFPLARSAFPRRRHLNRGRRVKSARVDARTYPMTAVGFHRGAATAKSGEEKDGAEED